MKFAHLSDLHLGKKLHQLSLLEDQKFILEEIIRIVDREQVEGVLLSGDIYDKPYPSGEAVALFDSFLVQLARSGRKIFVISGNHDSPERIAFLGRLTSLAGVYLSPVYSGEINKIRLEDEFGPINVFLLPFLKPVHVRHFFPEEGIKDYTEALALVIRKMEIKEEERNLILAHQFVTGAMRSDSEEVTVGGLDHVSAQVFEPFDYTALGHLHRPQYVGKEKIRYCGTPLKYSFSESEDSKSITIVELKKKGELEIKTIPLIPLREMLRLKGTFLQLMEEGEKKREESYVQITLLDEEDVPNAFGRLALVYPGLLHLEYDNRRTRKRGEIRVRRETAELSPGRLLADFYERMNNQPLNEKQLAYLEKKMEDIWKGGEV